MAKQALRKGAETGHAGACMHLAQQMYADHPYAREVGLVGEASGVAAPASWLESHDVPLDVLTSAAHWLRKGEHDHIGILNTLRRRAMEGAPYCHNDGCEFVGLLKAFKVCPQCKTARYCGDACQKEDWTTGGHKATCGTIEQI